MIVMREGNWGQTERFQVFRRMEIGERPVCPRFSCLIRAGLGKKIFLPLDADVDIKAFQQGSGRYLGKFLRLHLMKSSAVYPAL